MARQLVGISAMLPYMLGDKTYNSFAQLHFCNVITELKKGRVDEILRKLSISHTQTHF